MPADNDVDLTDFDELTNPSGVPLKVDVILARLDPARAASLRAALAGTYSNLVIAQVLRAWGHPIAEESVRKWRMRQPT